MDAKGIYANYSLLILVSIHAPVMDANISQRRHKKPRSFNPRARDGREDIEVARIRESGSFNPRARHGREANLKDIRQWLTCFNPRARDGREPTFDSLTLAHHVSIHAPVMDAK